MTLYRKGVNAYIINDPDQLLIIQKQIYDNNQWDIPGGGLEPNEEIETGLLRELEEELGTNKFQILEKSSITNKYDWPENIIKDYFAKTGINYSGQEKHQYLVKFLGKPEDIKIQPEELKDIKWIKMEELKNYLIFDGQYELARKTLDSFKTLSKIDI